MTAIASHYVDTSPATEPASAPRAKALARLGPPNRVMVPVVKGLLHDVCHAFGVTPADVHSRDRHKVVAQARHAFWWLARRFWDFSYPELGRLIGEQHAFDHTTVRSACMRVQDAVVSRTPYGLAVQALALASPSPEVTTGARVYELWSPPGLTLELDTEATAGAVHLGPEGK